MFYCRNCKMKMENANCTNCGSTLSPADEIVLCPSCNKMYFKPAFNFPCQKCGTNIIVTQDNEANVEQNNNNANVAQNGYGIPNPFANSQPSQNEFVQPQVNNQEQNPFAGAQPPQNNGFVQPQPQNNEFVQSQVNNQEQNPFAGAQPPQNDSSDFYSLFAQQADAQTQASNNDAYGAINNQQNTENANFNFGQQNNNVNEQAQNNGGGFDHSEFNAQSQQAETQQIEQSDGLGFEYEVEDFTPKGKKDKKNKGKNKEEKGDIFASNAGDKATMEDEKPKKGLKIFALVELVLVIAFLAIIFFKVISPYMPAMIDPCQRTWDAYASSLCSESENETTKILYLNESASGKYKAYKISEEKYVVFEIEKGFSLGEFIDFSNVKIYKIFTEETEAAPGYVKNYVESLE